MPAASPGDRALFAAGMRGGIAKRPISLPQRKVKKVHVVMGDTSIASKSQKKEDLEWKAAHETHMSQQWIDEHDLASDNPLLIQDHRRSDKRRKQHESNFFVLINTNKNPSEPMHTSAVSLALQQACEALGNDSVLCQCLIWGPKNPEHYGNDQWDTHIKTIEFNAGVERGPRNSMIHAHVMLRIEHFSQIQINSNYVARFIRDEYNRQLDRYKGFDGVDKWKISKNALPYVQIKLLPQRDFADIIDLYIRKTVVE